MFMQVVSVVPYLDSVQHDAELDVAYRLLEALLMLGSVFVLMFFLFQGWWD